MAAGLLALVCSNLVKQTAAFKVGVQLKPVNQWQSRPAQTGCFGPTASQASYMSAQPSKRELVQLPPQPPQWAGRRVGYVGLVLRGKID